MKINLMSFMTLGVSAVTLLQFIKEQGSILTVDRLCRITSQKHDNTFRNWVKSKPELLKATVLGADAIYKQHCSNNGRVR